VRRMALLWLTAKVYRGYTRYDFIQLPVLLLLVGWATRLTSAGSFHGSSRG